VSHKNVPGATGTLNHRSCRFKYFTMVPQKYKKNEIRQNKRRLATLQGVEFDLEKELPKLFLAFNEACRLFDEEVVQTPPNSRARGFEASLMNSKMIQCMQKYFPNECRFGKYRRFTLRINGYIILFKKLDRRNRPMNITTKSVQAISNQLSLPLFSEREHVDEPILFFGYNRTRVGDLSEPKLVYLDDEQIQWVITSNDVVMPKTEELKVVREKVVAPTLKPSRKGNQKAS